MKRLALLLVLLAAPALAQNLSPMQAMPMSAEGEAALYNQLSCWPMAQEYDERNPCARLVQRVYCDHFQLLTPDVQNLILRQFACGGDDTSYAACMKTIQAQEAYMFETAKANPDMEYLLLNFRTTYRDTIMKVCSHGG